MHQRSMHGSSGSDRLRFCFCCSSRWRLDDSLFECFANNDSSHWNCNFFANNDPSDWKHYLLGRRSKQAYSIFQDHHCYRRHSIWTTTCSLAWCRTTRRNQVHPCQSCTTNSSTNCLNLDICKFKVSYQVGPLSFWSFSFCRSIFSFFVF